MEIAKKSFPVFLKFKYRDPAGRIQKFSLWSSDVTAVDLLSVKEGHSIPYEDLKGDNGNEEPGESARISV